jgi:hypothetical protein
MGVHLTIRTATILRDVKYNVIYDSFVDSRSWRKCRRKFYRKHPDSTVPYKATIYNIVIKLYSSESVMDKNKSQRSHILSEKNNWWHRYSIRSKQKWIITSSGSWLRVGRNYRGRWIVGYRRKSMREENRATCGNQLEDKLRATFFYKLYTINEETYFYAIIKYFIKQPI